MMICDDENMLLDVCPSMMFAAERAAAEADMPVPLFLKLFLLGCMEDDLRRDGCEGGMTVGVSEVEAKVERGELV